jgi:hypothetical protein
MIDAARLVRARLLAAQTEAGLSVRAGARPCFLHAGKACAGLTKQLSKRRVFPRFCKWLLEYKKGSSLARGKRVDRCVQHNVNCRFEPCDCPPFPAEKRIMQHLHTDFVKRGIVPLVAQLVVASQARDVLTAADVVGMRRDGDCMVILEIKSGFNADIDAVANRAQRDLRLTKGVVLRDSLRHRHMLQAALTARMFEHVYTPKRIETYVVYVDRRAPDAQTSKLEWVSVHDAHWTDADTMDKVLQKLGKKKKARCTDNAR